MASGGIGTHSARTEHCVVGITANLFLDRTTISDWTCALQTAERALSLWTRLPGTLYAKTLSFVGSV